MKLRVQLLALLGIAMSIASVSAQTVVWQPPSLLNSVFNLGTNWVGLLPPGPTDTAVFTSSNSSNPSISAAISVAGVSFDNSGGSYPDYLLSSTNGSALTIGAGGVTLASNGTANVVFDSSLGIQLSANQTWTVNGTTTLEVQGAIGGSFGLTKAGTGQLNLSGNNTYTGTTTISGGTLQIGTGGSTGSVAGPIVNNGELVFNRADTVDYHTTSISGTGNLTQTGGGTLVLGTNSYTGKTLISGATISISSDGGLGSAPVAQTPASLTLDSGALETTGTFVLSANRGITLTSGGGTILTDAGTTLTYTGIIVGTGCSALYKDGDGTLILGGANNYFDDTKVIGGTLSDTTAGGFSANSAFRISSVANLNVSGNETIASLNDFEGGGTVTISSGKTLSLNSFGAFSGNITGTGGALQLLSGASQTLSGNVTISGGTTINSNATLTIGDGDRTGSISGPIANNGTLSFFMPGNVTVSGITGSGDVEKFGSGMLILDVTNSNTYTGNTWVSDGFVSDAAAGAFPSSSNFHLTDSPSTLKVNFNEAIGGLEGVTSSTTDISAGATLTINSAGLVFNGNVIGSGAVVISGKSSQTFSGNNSYGGGTTITGGTLIVTGTSTGNVTIANGATLQLGNGGPGGTLAGDVTNNGNFVYASTDNFIYNGIISGSGGLKIGTISFGSTGMLTLTGANTLSGQITIADGTLQIGASNALPITSVLSFSGDGVLDVANNLQIARFAGTSDSASIHIASGTTFTIAPLSLTFGGSFIGEITGAGSLALAGAAGTGVLLSNGDSSYSGGTTISSGTLFVGASSFSSGGNVTGGPVGTGTVSIAANAGLSASKTAEGDITLGNNLSLATSAMLGGAGNSKGLILSGTVTVPASTATVQVANLVEFTGLLQATAPTALTFSSVSGSGFGNVLLLNAPANPAGSNLSNITSITASGAGVIFGSQSAVPNSGLNLQASTGYIGIGAVPGYTTPTASSVIGLIGSPGTFAGTLGFDTASHNSAPHIFSDALSLSSFGANFSLGSLSKAVLTGNITPSAGGYVFGNGGGALFVQSALTGSPGVTVASTTLIPNNYLTTVFQGANSFAGNMSVTNSLGLLDSATALPTGKTIALGADGYVGYSEAFTGATSFANFLTRVTSYTPTSIVGLDSHDFLASAANSASPSGTRTSFETIDLRALGLIYFGTATQLELNGPIYAPTASGASGTLSLLAGHDGSLVINSPLVAGNVSSVVIGSTSAAYGDGTISLLGNNSYAGGTTLKSGTLAVNQGSLGTGSLTVPVNANQPTIAASSGYVFLSNPVALTGTLNAGVEDHGNSKGFDFGNLVFDGVISGGGSLNIFDGATFTAANTFSGGVNLFSGGLWIGADGALGGGTLTINSGVADNPAYIGVYNGPHTLANNVVYNGSNASHFTIYTRSSLTLTGNFALNNSLDLAVMGQSLTLTGSLSGNGHFRLDSGTVMLSPTTQSTYTGGIEALSGSIILGSTKAISSTVSTSLTADVGSYIGLAGIPGNVQSDFIDHFNKSATLGTIGFDSANIGSPNTFNDPINLQGFSSTVQIGSATAAILGSGATITPRSNTYFFGGGGGTLTVASPLVDNARLEVPTRSVAVMSFGANPLTLQLTGANTYTGPTLVGNSALIFGSSSSVPASSQFVLSTGGYIGLNIAADAQGTDSAITGFLGHFGVPPTMGYVGFDSAGGNKITNLDVTALGTGAFGIATTSTLHLDGTLTLASGANSYRFAGYKGGQLTVDSLLTGSRSVVIGDTSVDATFANPLYNTVYSTVTLTGNNTYSGGTTLNAGQLYVGNDNALGSGQLTIANKSLGDQNLGLFASGGARTVANSISVGSTLDIGGSSNLSLTGGLVGVGDLNKVGAGTLTLSGDNSEFSGDVYVRAGTIIFSHGNSVGGGALQFGFSGGIVTFSESSVINGISGDSIFDTINLTAGTTLTVHQKADGEYSGVFAGTTAGLTFDGTGTQLTLSGPSTFTGPTSIGSGVTLVAGNANAFGTTANAVTVNGGTLASGSGVTVSNPITLNSGKIGGIGSFQVPVSAAGFNITSGVVLSPGISGPGSLAFDGTLISGSALLLSGGGTYNWQIVDATNGNGGWDSVVVHGKVDIAATTTNHFILSIISVSSDGSSNPAVNFDPSLAYSWVVLNAQQFTFSGTGGTFNANAFTLNTSGFQNSNVGQFSLSLDNTGTNLVLNFSPIPEPSTYALMIAGLGVTALATRRRRRRG
jgi:fibronectin-binding autotransporter adhesin